MKKMDPLRLIHPTISHCFFIDTVSFATDKVVSKNKVLLGRFIFLENVYTFLGDMTSSRVKPVRPFIVRHK